MTGSPSGRSGSARPSVGWLSPRLWGLHVLLVVAVAFTTFMGLWQLGAYEERRDDAQANLTKTVAVPLQDVLGPDDPYTSTADYQPVTVTGTYGPTDEQVWIEGREHEGREGYWLVAPIVVDGVEPAVADRQPALLVVRGWSAEAGALPPTPQGEVSLEAVLQVGDARGSAFDVQTRTLDSIRIPRLVNEMPYDLYGGYGIVTAHDPADAAALTPATVPEPTSDSTAGTRNLFYAIEWWIFGAFALLMWWRMCQDIRREGTVTTSHVPAAKRAAQEAARARARAREAEPVEEKSPSGR
ncbi:SURF1 family protein [Mumia sp. ZJ1417]|uniref:SURF1 family protein n=1 Tax=unclassified Mumia TaxID=2621872 RepID=UPI00141F5303|nr:MULTISPECIES: SURF1 family protein [unclassified Mumia]QMW66438.1 SURF1 family protein [Mumia sp. ZJ1417]